MKLEKLVPILSVKQIEYFTENGIINWIWIKWKNIEDVILDIIKATYRFEEEQSHSLLFDLRQLADYHDIMYTFKLWFNHSNLWLAYKVYKLIDWDVLRRRIGVFIGILIILNKYWKENYG